MEFFSSLIFPQPTRTAIDSSPIAVGAWVNVVSDVNEFRKSIFMVGLNERHLAFRISIIGQKYGETVLKSG